MEMMSRRGQCRPHIFLDSHRRVMAIVLCLCRGLILFQMKRLNIHFQAYAVHAQHAVVRIGGEPITWCSLNVHVVARPLKRIRYTYRHEHRYRSV